MLTRIPYLTVLDPEDLQHPKRGPLSWTKEASPGPLPSGVPLPPLSVTVKSGPRLGPCREGPPYPTRYPTPGSGEEEVPSARPTDPGPYSSATVVVY